MERKLGFQMVTAGVENENEKKKNCALIFGFSL